VSVRLSSAWNEAGRLSLTRAAAAQSEANATRLPRFSHEAIVRSQGSPRDSAAAASE